jgi:hypothetical protein
MNDASHPSKPAFPQPVSGTVVPRFGDVATFMRLPLFRDPADVEIGMVGVPWDGGTTNRPGRPPRSAPDARPVDHDAPRAPRHWRGTL